MKRFALALLAFLPLMASAQTTYVAPLEWKAPTLNTDGSALTDLASYRILYGQSLASLAQQLTVAGTLTAYNVPGLAAGTWYFELVAINSKGVQSAPTNPVSIVCPCVPPVPLAPGSIIVAKRTEQ